MIKFLFDAENRYPTAIDLQIDLEDFAREARLPVSSARMGRFMRGLFDEEIKAATAEMSMAPASDVPGGTMIVSPSSPPEGISDLTPSEVRLHAEPTPGIIQDDGGVSGTDISFSDAPAPRRSPAIALGAGFLLTLALGGGAYMAFGGSDDPPAATEDAPEVKTIESAPVEPDEPAQPEADAPKEPTNVDGIVPEAETPADPAESPGGEKPSGTELPGTKPEAPASSAEPDAGESPEPSETASVKPKPTKPKPRPKTKKKKTPKPPPEPPPEPKKKKKPYDANSARLPGM